MSKVGDRVECNLNGLEIRLEPFHCMSCGKKPTNGRRGFCNGKECAKCYVKDTVDRIFDLMEDREAETKRARPDVYESQQYNKAKRMAVASRALIRHVGGTTHRKDKRLRRNLVRAMERMDEMLEDHPDEEDL